MNDDETLAGLRTSLSGVKESLTDVHLDRTADEIRARARSRRLAAAWPGPAHGRGARRGPGAHPPAAAPRPALGPCTSTSLPGRSTPCRAGWFTWTSANWSSRTCCGRPWRRPGTGDRHVRPVLHPGTLQLRRRQPGPGARQDGGRRRAEAHHQARGDPGRERAVDRDRAHRHPQRAEGRVRHRLRPGQGRGTAHLPRPPFKQEPQGKGPGKTGPAGSPAPASPKAAG